MSGIIGRWLVQMTLYLQGRHEKHSIIVTGELSSFLAYSSSIFISSVNVKSQNKLLFCILLPGLGTLLFQLFSYLSNNFIFFFFSFFHTVLCEFPFVASRIICCN